MPPRFQIPFGFVVYLCPEEYLLFMKILIVEDEPSLREIMVQTLRREQYVVEQASDYASALEKIAGYDYDCILLDIMLPALNGMEVLRRLRRESLVPVIMLTAKGETSDKVSGLKEAMRVLNGVEDIAICRLGESDVVRHALVQRIIKAYEVDEDRKGGGKKERRG